MDKGTASMSMFNGYVSFPEGTQAEIHLRKNIAL